MSDRAKRAAAVVLVLIAGAGVLVALNWATLTTTSAEVLAAEGFPHSRELTVTFGSCLKDYTVTVEESSDEVRVLVLLQTPRINECPDIAALETLVLAEPLGDRTVVDASRNAPVEVRPPLG
jgi:hypothetical protein